MTQLTGSDAVFYVMKRLTQMKQAVNHADIFTDSNDANEIFNNALKALKEYAKKLIVEEAKK